MYTWTVPIHIEILLPSFCLGMITEEHEDEEDEEEHVHDYTVQDLKLDRKMSILKEGNEEEYEEKDIFVVKQPVQNQNQINKVHPKEDKDDEFEDDNGKDETLTTEEIVQFYISASFMLLVGLSMPSIIKTPDSSTAHRMLAELDIPRLLSESSSSNSKQSIPNDAISPIMYVVHILVCSALLVIGKLFPTFCYSSEATFNERLALSVGMCPRGEVGAGVIMISLGYGITGPILIISVMTLALNLVSTGMFISIVVMLLRTE